MPAGLAAGQHDPRLCRGLQNVQNVPPRRGCRRCRPCAPQPCSSFTPLLGHFLALAEATPEMFFHTLLLSALPTRAHTTEAFCAFCVSSASWARSGFLQCHSGKGGEQCQPCLSAGHLGKPRAFPWHLLLATGRAGP